MREIILNRCGKVESVERKLCQILGNSNERKDTAEAQSTLRSAETRKRVSASLGDDFLKLDEEGGPVGPGCPYNGVLEQAF